MKRRDNSQPVNIIPSNILSPTQPPQRRGDVDNDSSKMDLIEEEGIRVGDLFNKMKKNGERLSASEYLHSNQSPGLDEFQSTMKEIDLAAYFQRKVFECPPVLPEDPQDILMNERIKSRLQVGGGDNLYNIRKRKSDLHTFDIFSQFYSRDTGKKSFSERLVRSYEAQLLSMVITVYALFAEDYRLLLCSRDTDNTFQYFAIACGVYFLCEMILSMIVSTKYFNSYYFWLDLLSALSMLLDVRIVDRKTEYVYGLQSSSFSLLFFRVTRLLRIVRLVRITRIYKGINAARQRKKIDANRLSSTRHQSKVGQKIAEKSTKIVTITCFILLLCLPYFDAELYFTDIHSSVALCMQYANFMKSPQGVTIALSRSVYSEDILSSTRLPPFSQSPVEYLNEFTKKILPVFENQRARILMIRLNREYDYYVDGDYSLKRDEEISHAVCTYKLGGIGADLYIDIFVDSQLDIQLVSILNILKIFFICILVLGGSYLFGHKISSLMITPIERMIERVSLLIQKPQKIREQCIIKLEEEDTEKKESRTLQRFKTKLSINDSKGGKKKAEDDDDEDDADQKKEEELETEKIEKAINKIGTLLGLGFGEAGTFLINSYLTKQGDGDIIIPGNEIEAIFGFCDIRNFTDVTEVLEEEVMSFVNEIAEIVHNVSDRYLGAANKNVGDAFLLVWKPPSSVLKHMKMTKTNMMNLMTCLADLALMAFLKIFFEINCSFRMKAYRDNREIKERVGMDYKVRMGYGLHYGWAIEGAIGSYFKVDCTYLSPNVNMASRLEGITKLYDVPILFSGEFYDLLSISLKHICRKIDIVLFKGSSHAVRLYTPDISDKGLRFPSFEELTVIRKVTKESLEFKNLLIDEILNGTNVGPPVFENDPQMRLLLSFNSPSFRSAFNTAVEAYERGEWKMSKDFLERALTISPNDGPSKSLYNFMNNTKFLAPKDWKGVRSSIEK